MKQERGTVGDLVGAFGECLRALTPLLPEVGSEWEDAKQYDDWDAIAGALYSSIVASSVAYAVEGQPFERLVPYGHRLPTYTGRSHLYCRELGQSAVFLRLETTSVPFDMAAFCGVDAAGAPTGRIERAPLTGVGFAARLRSSQGERDVDTVILREIEETT
jgi:hypothetical protein